MISLFGRNDKTARYNLLYFFEHNLSGQAFSTRFFSEKEKRAQTNASILCASLSKNYSFNSIL
tara:strand:- start:365 stop:553 length:189 start_codon:yes stop_codon:yes gene_type:complete